MTPHEYLLKGDNNIYSDGWFDKKHIIGIVEKIENRPGLSYTPGRWHNRIIALASQTHLLTLRKTKIIRNVRNFIVGSRREKGRIL